MKMPVGKHKDRDLIEIPRSYLGWLRSQAWVGDWLLRGIDHVLSGVPHA